MSNDEHERYVLRAEHARAALAADLQKIHEVGAHMVHYGKAQLRNSALFALGAAALGGMLVGFALGRAAAGRRGGAAAAPLASTLLAKLTTMAATALATRLVATLAPRRS